MSGLPQKIKAIFFDIGGVLVRVDSSRAIRNLSVRLGLEESVIREAMNPALLQAYEKGHLSSNQFYDNLLQYCAGSRDMDLETFKDYWQDVLFPREESIALLRRLSRAYPIWLLSNTNDFHYELLLREFAFMQWVRGGTYSFLEGSMKPEALIYEQALKQAGFQAREVLFIDDLEANVLAARDLGIQALLYIDYETLTHQLRHEYPELESFL